MIFLLQECHLILFIGIQLVDMLVWTVEGGFLHKSGACAGMAKRQHQLVLLPRVPTYLASQAWCS